MKRKVSEVEAEKLVQELKDLETRGDDELKERWAKLYRTEPPSKIQSSMLRQTLSPIGSLTRPSHRSRYR
jgi:hypothetical protein